MWLPKLDRPEHAPPDLTPGARKLEVGTLVLWLAGVAGCFLLWIHFQQPSNLPAEGSWGWRLLALLRSVPSDDAGVIQRVRVTRIAVILSFACLAMVGYLERERVIRAVRRYFTTPSHPINLAIFRIVVFYQIYKLGYFNLIATIVALPDAMQSPPLTGVPPIGPLAAFAHWPLNPLGPSEVLALGQVMKVACITGILGFFTRTSSLVVAFTFFIGWGAQQWYGKVDHHHHVLWFVLILAVSRSGDALSLDSLIRAWRGGSGGTTEPPKPGLAYGLPLRLSILLMGVLYFFPGFWKIWKSGFDWFLSDSPFNRMYTKWHMLGGWLPSIRPDDYPLLVHAGALGTILFELSFIFLIFGPRTIYLAGVMGATFHTALNVFMRYGFESLRNSYVVFVNWHRGLVWAGRRLYPGGLSVHFDSRDRRTAPLIACARSLDWLDAIAWHDGTQSTVEIRAGGRTWRGVAAWKRLTRRLPLLWPLAIPLSLLPDRWLGRGVASRQPDSTRLMTTGVGRGRAGIMGPLLVGGSLVVGNTWAGLTRMQNGWPLACYPMFDNLIDESYTALRIVAVDAGGAEQTLVPDDYRDVLGQNWNLMLRRILGERDDGQRNTLLRSVWDVLKAREPSLTKTSVVKFYTVRSSIRPELWNSPPTDPELILTLRL